MSSLKRILIGVLAAVGLGAGHTAATAVQQSEVRQSAIAKSGESTKSIEADLFGRYSGGMARQFFRSGGHSPKEWGMSRACARMVRKNRMRALGVAGSRI